MKIGLSGDGPYYKFELLKGGFLDRWFNRDAAFYKL